MTEGEKLADEMGDFMVAAFTKMVEYVNQKSLEKIDKKSAILAALTYLNTVYLTSVPQEERKAVQEFIIGQVFETIRKINELEKNK